MLLEYTIALMFENNVNTQMQNNILPYLHVCARKHAISIHISCCTQTPCSHGIPVMVYKTTCGTVCLPAFWILSCGISSCTNFSILLLLLLPLLLLLLPLLLLPLLLLPLLLLLLPLLLLHCCCCCCHCCCHCCCCCCHCCCCTQDLCSLPRLPI